MNELYGLGEGHYVVSPLGFLRPIIDTRVDINFEGNKEIDTWFTYMRDSRVSDQVRREVIEYCHDLFSLCGGVEKLLRWNFDIANISATKRRFINDTLRFIQTGKRRIDVATQWALFHHAEGEDVPTIQPKVEYDISLIQNNHDMLSKWISHEGGFMDLLWTLRILFGSKDTTKDWN